MKTIPDQSGSFVRLTKLQTAVCEYLRVHSGETISREQLCSSVWQMNYFRTSRTIDQTISVVRKHLAKDERIVTVFGVGYRHELHSQQPGRADCETGEEAPFDYRVVTIS